MRSGYGIPRKDADRGRLLAYGIAAFVAAAGTAVLLIMTVVGSSNGAVGSGSGSGSDRQSGFIFFDEFHTVVLVEPGAAGQNSIDVAVAYHDGTIPTNVTAVDVTIGRDGQELGDFTAEPVSGSPGIYRVSGVSIPSAGDWDFGVTVAVTDEEPVSDTTVISIGEPSSGT